MNIYGVLHHVLDEQGISSGESDSSDSWIGVRIRKANTAQAGRMYSRLIQTVNPTGRTLGWIGYELVEEQKSPYLSAWFYATPKTTKRIRSRLQRAMNQGAFHGTLKEEGSHVAVRLPGNESKNDAEWYRSVLRAAAAG